MAERALNRGWGVRDGGRYAMLPLFGSFGYFVGRCVASSAPWTRCCICLFFVEAASVYTHVGRAVASLLTTERRCGDVLLRHRVVMVVRGRRCVQRPPGCAGDCARRHTQRAGSLTSSSGPRAIGETEPLAC